jgi:hypothetical protein
MIKIMYRVGSLMTVSRELSRYRLDLVGMQEVRWEGSATVPAADETLDKERNQGNKAWFDEECVKAVSEKNNARKRMLQRETRKNYGRYQELRREAN